MKNKLRSLSYFLVLSLLLFTSCNGQAGTDKPADHAGRLHPDTLSNNPALPAGQPRMSSGLLQDKAGNLWAISDKKGVSRFDGKSFVHFTEKDGLSSRFVYCMLEDKAGILWFGTADGVTCYDGKTFSIIPITAIKGKNFSYTKTQADATYDVPYPEQNFVASMLQDSRGVFWFGTSGGIYRYDPSKDVMGARNFTPFEYNDSITYNDGGSIESILEDRAGNIWFGGRGTVGAYRYDGKSLTSSMPDGNNWVMPVLETKTGEIWFARRNPSMYRYDGSNFNVFGQNEFSDWFFYMEEDKAGNLWFANGKDGGVTYYDGRSFTNFTAKDGMDSQAVLSILEDNVGMLWFRTPNGLYRYDGKAFTRFAG